MKYNIAQLVDAWVLDNKYYIDENYEDVEAYLCHWIENGEFWYTDFFTSSEIENMSESEMKEIAVEFAQNYRGIKAIEE